MKVIDVLETLKSYNRFDGDMGIEIETEAKAPYQIPKFFFWNHTNDNSLRDFGIEYVLKQPLPYKDIKKALKEFQDKTKDISFIKDSISTSVHVHINMMNEDLITLANFLTTYTLFENLLIRFSGPDRLSNLFCLPIIDAEAINDNTCFLLKGINAKNYKAIALGENAVKYAALNLSSLHKYGSLEIRSFRGETDIEKIQEWVDILYRILEFSREDLTPNDILDSFKKDGIKIKDKIFKEYSKLLSHPSEIELVEQNVYFAGKVAYSIPDWDVFQHMIDPRKFKPSVKQLDIEALAKFKKAFEELSPGESDFVYNSLKRSWEESQKTKTSTKKKNSLHALLNNAIAENIPVGLDNNF